MNQEYTEDKEVILRSLSGGRRLLEVLLLVVGLFAIYLLVALISFDPADPSWSQTAWHEPIHNYGGVIGAWIADTLLFTFGVLAYTIPFILLSFVWFVFRQQHYAEHTDFFMLALRITGALALITTSCGLAEFSADDIYYFASGGVIGSLINNVMHPWLNNVGATLLLMFVWAAGLTLFTGWSWLIIAEKIGEAVMGCLTFLTNRTRPDIEHSITEPLMQSNEAEDVLIPLAQSGDPLFSTAAISSLPENNDLDGGAESEVPVMYTSGYAEEEQPVSPLSRGESLLTMTAVATEMVLPSVQESTPLICTTIHDSESAVPVGEGESPTFGHLPVPLEQDKTMGSFSAEHDEHITAGTVPYINPGLAAGTVPFGVAERNNKVSDTELAGVSKMLFMPVAEASVVKSQVKQGIGPELPRPNPVRLPSRRKLAAYGIKLPSHRLADRQAEQKEHGLNKSVKANSAVVSSADDETLAQTELNQGLEAKQPWSELTAKSPKCQDEDVFQQEALHQAFETHKAKYQMGPSLTIKQRSEIHSEAKNVYHSSLASDHLISTAIVCDEQMSELNDSGLKGFSALGESLSVTVLQQIQAEGPFSLSPIADLVDDTPREPLFTLSSQLEESMVQVAKDEDAPLNLFQPVVDPAPEPAQLNMNSLIHPFLMRNDQPLPKSTTPLPTLDLLALPPATEVRVDMDELEQVARLIEARLADYRVKANVVEISPGPVVTCFELDLAPGVKAARISNLSRDLARSLSAVAVRIVEVIPGKPYVGLELPNKYRQTVHLREVLDCARFRETKSPLAVVLGKDISGQPVIADLAKMPHLLVAGTTGSGKSVGVNAMIISILYKAKPEEVKFIMIDPKMLELSVYEGIPHLLTEVVTDMKDAANALRWCVNEMERRYKLMSALGVRNISGYNERVAQAEEMGRPIPDPFWKPGDSMDIQPPVLEKLPYIVVMVDEFADLIMAVGKKVEELIARLAQKARAAGIHLVLATQRPSVDVITGLIKANIPTRIAFTVSSKIDSRTILDQGGAESLLGMGDMLYLPPNSSLPVRVHGAFVRDQEVHDVVQDWKARGRPQYIDSILSTSEEGEGGFGLEGDEALDPLFDQAVAFVVDKRRASISGVQRQFRIGYNRAARIIEQMEYQGIVSPQGHNGNREVLAPSLHE